MRTKVALAIFIVAVCHTGIDAAVMRALDRRVLEPDFPPPERFPEEPIFLPEFPIHLPELPMKLTTKSPIKQLIPDLQNDPTSQDPLDLAFIMDTTGSMSSYIETARKNIRRVVDEISQSQRQSIRFALVEYRDHPPEDRTYVVRKHDFTSSVSTMKSWLDASRATGGGDTPEAVADALYEATTLSWRQSAVKIAVLISDAPPHGLDSSYGSGPQVATTYDPIKEATRLAKQGVTLYSVGCEPDIVPYRDFFMALAFIAGGQYIPLGQPQKLIDAIIGGAKEELSLQQFSSDVQAEIQKQQASGGPIDREQIAQSVYNKLASANTQTTQLLLNSRPLDGPTSGAKAIAATSSLAEARAVFTKTAPDSSRISSRKHFGGMAMEGGFAMDSFESPRMFSGAMSRMAAPVAMDVPAAGGAGEVYTAVKSDITLEQVKRLVSKESAAIA